jgi:5'(3')-deoxyribonucleotidase
MRNGRTFHTPLIVYFDMDNTMFDFTVAYNDSKRKNPEIEYPQSQQGFFENLEPIPGAIETFKRLTRYRDFDPYILTAPSILNPLCYTEKRNCIEKHLGTDALNRLIISPVKNLSKGDILIDDMAHGKGQERFDGHLILFGSPRFPDWKSINKYFTDMTKGDE